MTYKKRFVTLLLSVSMGSSAIAQIDVEHVISIGRNALYFNDYVVSIGYFNRAIDARPWIAAPYLYRSIAKISLDDYQGAIDDATQCIERNPYISRAYLVRGIAHQNLSRLDSAVADYRAGLALAPDHQGMRYNLTASLLSMGKYDEAETASAEMIRYAPRNNEIYALRAGISLERGDTTQALERISTALEREPNQSLPYRLRASIFASRKAWAEAIESISSAIDLEPSPSAELYANRGIMHYHSHNIRQALADYSTALEIDPRNRISLHNRALLLQFVGELNLSLEDWDRLVELEPSNHIARYNRAHLLGQTNQRLKDAIADLDIILKLYPSFGEGFIQRSLLRKRMGDTKGAEQDYWHAWDLQQNPAYQARAHAIAKQNQDNETRKASDTNIDKYSMLIEASSTSLPTQTKYNSEARGRVQDGQVQVQPRPQYYLTYFAPVDTYAQPISISHYARLLEDFNKAAAKPNMPLGLQSALITLQAEQIQILEDELRGNESQPTAWGYLRMGIAQALLQDYKQSMMALDKAIELDPNLALAHFAYATSAVRERYAERDRRASNDLSDTESSLLRGETVSALDRVTNMPILSLSLTDIDPLYHLNRTIALAPDFAYAYYNRGWLLSEQGEVDKAIADYSKAIELAPRMAEAYYNRGLLLISQGKNDTGTSDLSRAGELGLYQAYSLIKQMNK